MRSFLTALTLVLLLAAGPAASADIIRYQFQNYAFDDGGVATGFFDFDTSLAGPFSFAGNSANFEISVSGGSTASFPAFTYTDENSGPFRRGAGTTSGEVIAVGDYTGSLKRGLYFIVDPSATLGVDPAASLMLSPGNTSEIANISALSFRRQISGSITAAPVPEPTAAALLGLTAITLLPRRRARRG